jgi:two-component system, chemotaxis family, sensor kinase CheA
MVPEQQTSSTRPPTVRPPSATAPALHSSIRLAVLPPLPSTAGHPPQIALGIRVKLVALMVATSFLIVGILASYFPSQQIAEMRTAVRDRATMYGRLASIQLRPAIAFRDRQTAREVLSAIAKDPLVVGIAVYSDNGTPLATQGTLTELADASRHGFGELRSFYLPGRVLVTAPVQSLEGPKGTFVVEVSTGATTAARARLIHAALGVGAGALAFGSILAWAIARSLASRVEGIAEAASAVAQGNLERRLALDGPQDEIAVLAFGFNAMVARLRDLIQHIQEAAREENQLLEVLVQERTRELDRRNVDLRLVLDNVEQGFVTMDRGANVVGEHSRVVEQWLGQLSEGDPVWRRLESVSPGCGAAYDLAWSQLLDDVMPAEVSLAQLPEQLTVNGRYLRFEYKPLGASDSFERLLLVISDVTASVERKRSEQDVQDILEVAGKLLNDRGGFLEFVQETQGLLRRMTQGNPDVTSFKRDLHTLKGNTALFGMSLVSEQCHEAEARIELAPDAAVDCSRIVAQWELTYARVQHLLADGNRCDISVTEQDYLGLLAAIRTGVDQHVLGQMVAAWRLEPLRTRLERAAEQLSATLARLEKDPVQVIVDAPRLYLGREELGEFWSAFAHVVRNAAVHGLDSAEERTRLAKTGVPRFVLRAGIAEERLFVQLEDSGPGIDWETLRVRAVEWGLPSSSRAELVDVLFTDGVSTLNSVSEIAGRGVGLSAVRAACVRRSGAVDVLSRSGRGSTFRFSWPVASFKSLIRFDLGEAS